MLSTKTLSFATRLFTLCFALFIICGMSGCAGFIADQIMDSATENAIKLMEAEAKISKEKRSESYTIEGRFQSLEMRTEKVAEEDPAKIQTTKKVDGNKVEMSLEMPSKTIKTCVVTFEDGREKAFRNVPAREMEKGKRYIITYNGMNEITQTVEAKAE